MGGRDAFIRKLNATGSALLYSTYLGGSDADGPSDIAADVFGNALYNRVHVLLRDANAKRCRIAWPNKYHCF